jgi:ankyrin repeat protein
LAGASVNTKNELGHTTLHIAAKNNNQEICRALLDNGADPNIADHEGNNSEFFLF